MIYDIAEVGGTVIYPHSRLKKFVLGIGRRVYYYSEGIGIILALACFIPILVMPVTIAPFTPGL